MLANSVTHTIHLFRYMLNGDERFIYIVGRNENGDESTYVVIKDCYVMDMRHDDKDGLPTIATTHPLRWIERESGYRLFERGQPVSRSVPQVIADYIALEAMCHHGADQLGGGRVSHIISIRRAVDGKKRFVEGVRCEALSMWGDIG
jgi:hypothetical protein